MKLIDTNIIAYAYDGSEIEKRRKCKKLIEQAFKESEEFCVTNQILGELFYTITKNFRKPLSFTKARVIVESIIDSEKWEKLCYTHETVRTAGVYVEKFGINFWDALIAATMIENNIFTIYTENDKDFKKIPGLEVINPLS